MAILVGLSFGLLWYAGHLFSKYFPNSHWGIKIIYCCLVPGLLALLISRIGGFIADSYSTETTGGEMFIFGIWLLVPFYITTPFTIRWRKKREGVSSAREVWGLKTKKKKTK